MDYDPIIKPVSMTQFRINIPENGYVLQAKTVNEKEILFIIETISDSCTPISKSITGIMQKFPDLFIRFSQIDPSNTDEILKFANMYGLLSSGSEFLDDNSEFTLKADPLFLWQRQIWKLQQTLSIYQASLMRNPTQDRTILHLTFIWDIADVKMGEQYDTLYYCFGHPDDLVTYHDSGIQFDRSSGKLLTSLKGFMIPSKHELVSLQDHPEWRTIAKTDYNFWAKILAQKIINSSLQEFPVTPQILFQKTNQAFNPANNSLKMHLRPTSLGAALWLQFLQYITGEIKLQQCPECGQWYNLSSSTQWKTVCPICNTRRRVRKNKVKKLHQAGASLDEIQRHDKKTDLLTLQAWLAEFKNPPG